MFRKFSLTFLLLTGCLMAAGCAVLLGDRTKNNLLFTDKDIDDIFKAYQKDANLAKERRGADLRKNIKRIDVARKQGEEEFLVSVDLENAPLKDVIEVILTKTETPFFLQDVKLAGAISGRFEKIPFIRALNIILNSEGYSARMSDEGILFIQASYESPSAPKPPAPAADVFPTPGAAPPSLVPAPPAPGEEPPSSAPAPPAPEAPPAPGGPQPSSLRNDSPPAMFRRTTLLVQAPVPRPPILRPPLPQIPGTVPPGGPLPGVPSPEPLAPPAGGQPPRPPQPEISVEYPLQHLNTESAEKILSRLFPAEGGVGGALPGAVPGLGGPVGEPSAEPVRFGVEPTRNTVVIRGPRDQVLKIRKVLQTIDREPQHVLIEVLFLEVSADALEKLNLAIQDYAKGKVSEFTTAIGTSNPALRFKFTDVIAGGTGFTTDLVFRSSLDLLYRKSMARVIARPYLASLTGRTSILKIAEDRSIVVQQAQGGAAVVSTKEISSGVELKITPTVHLSGSINMQLEVEESEFIPTEVGNVAASKNTNRATNIMQVSNGESIIIGGLMLNKRQWTKGGLPWLREVPILNVFTAAQQRTEVDKEVLVVVTPHLYTPGLRTPLPFLEVFQKDPIIKYTTPTERFEFDK